MRTEILLVLLGGGLAEKPPLKLTYFGVMAKGLAPSLVLELSGLQWEGVHPVDWADMKPTTIFGQLPQLETADGLKLAQMAAIVNFVSQRVPELHGKDEAEFAVSQMLLVFADDDLYRAMQKYQDTINQKNKVPVEETNEWWTTLVPGHLARLEALLLAQGHGGDRFTSGGFTTGELVLFAILHQMKLVRPGMLHGVPGVHAFYVRVSTDARVLKVLQSGGGFAQPLRQYFVPGREAPEATFADEL